MPRRGTPAPKSLPALLELHALGVPHAAIRLCQTQRVPHRGGILCITPGSDACSEGALLAGHRSAAQSRIPAGTHPWAPQRSPRKSTPRAVQRSGKRESCAQEGMFAREGKRTRRKRKRGAPLQPPLGGSLCSHSRARLAVAPRWLCPPAPSPRPPARSPGSSSPAQRTLTQRRGRSGARRQAAGGARSGACGRALVLAVQLSPPGQTSPLQPPVPARPARPRSHRAAFGCSWGRGTQWHPRGTSVPVSRSLPPACARIIES